MVQLPEAYGAYMKALLGTEEYEAYLQSFTKERAYGLRANGLKITPEALQKLLQGEVRLEGRVPWTGDGFYYRDSYPGRHPFYHAGLYYIQEPSAMYPGAALAAAGIGPEDKILDLCAAPGGKSVQIAGAMGGRGLLVSNDINEERVKALVKNLEMAGVRNAVILNEAPENLLRNFSGYFDKIIVDAPCSGEGMFRKDAEAVNSWGKFKSEQCRGMQDAILDQADLLLKDGGYLVYSTCTFTPAENECTVAAFLRRHPEYAIVPAPKPAGVENGVPAWGGGSEALAGAARLWPHKLRGEGHFTALLQKGDCGKNQKAAEDDLPADSTARFCGNARPRRHNRKEENRSYKLLNGPPPELCEFWSKNMHGTPWEGRYFTMGEHLCYLPCDPPCLDGLHTARAGVSMGAIRYGKLIPSHPFAMACGRHAFLRNLNFERHSEMLLRYLKGETITGLLTNEDGLTAVCVEGYLVGLGQVHKGVLKNLYPKGWRKN